MKELEAKDLRIGNLVYGVSDGQKILSDVVSLDSVNLTEHPIWLISKYNQTSDEYESVEPIPITEEWLLKLGFKEQNTEIGSRFRKKNFYIAKNTDFDFYLKDVKSGIYIHLTKLDFVHELQNIWYCLNGKDLKINDNLDNL